MTDSGPEPGENIVGNVYDKYGTRNPIARRLMAGFFAAVDELYRRAAPRRVLEVGCGEGKLAARLLERHGRPERFEICDLTLARLIPDLDPFVRAREASIYELPYADASFDLVVCCEVLEHLERPREGLAELRRVAADAVLVSTPREPLWRVLNMARGKYWRDLGNTPGHRQHFSRAQLRALVAEVARVEEVRAPIPWTVILARVEPGFDAQAAER